VLVVLIVLVPLVIGAWIATQTVYFVGTDAQGHVALFRGVPYALPAGVRLYSTTFVSGVTVAEMTPRQRGALLDHTLRSHDDAFDLVRQLELGRLGRS
jgi:protein phosphatase